MVKQWKWLKSIMFIEELCRKVTSSSERWKKEFNSERRSSTYDKAIDIFALRRAERLKVLKTLLPEASVSQFEILELGAGTGIITEFLVEHYPKANITAIEGAEKMMEQAQSKTLLRENEHRIEWILAEYSSPSWLENINGPFNLVVSVDSLHHLTHDRMSELYQEICGSIIRGGCLLLSDHITSHTPYYRDPQYKLWMQEVLENLKQVEKGSDIEVMLEKTYKDLQELSLATLQKKFTSGLKHEGENPMPLMKHIDVMREVGFDNVMVEYRYSHFAIISAQKGV